VKHYATVKPTLWTGETGVALRAAGADAQLIAAYLITCPGANSIGIFTVPQVVMVKHLNLSIARLRKGLAMVIETGFCKYSEAYQQVWIPEMSKHQFGEPLDINDKRVKGIHRLLKHVSESPFFGDFVRRYRESYHLMAFEAPSPIPCDAREQRTENRDTENREHPALREGHFVFTEPAFAEWYAIYPRKVKKDEARKAFPKALALIAVEHDDALAWLLDVTRQFASSPAGNAGKFTPHPTTWLNQGRYNDDPAEWHRRGLLADDPRGNLETLNQYLREGEHA
jgi:hypothetical protein